MSEISDENAVSAQQEELVDVEGHGLKEVALGLSAAAVVAGGAGSTALSVDNTASAAQAVQVGSVGDFPDTTFRSSPDFTTADPNLIPQPGLKALDIVDTVALDIVDQVDNPIGKDNPIGVDESIGKINAFKNQQGAALPDVTTGSLDIVDQVDNPIGKVATYPEDKALDIVDTIDNPNIRAVDNPNLRESVTGFGAPDRGVVPPTNTIPADRVVPPTNTIPSNTIPAETVRNPTGADNPIGVDNPIGDMGETATVPETFKSASEQPSAEVTTVDGTF